MHAAFCDRARVSVRGPVTACARLHERDRARGVRDRARRPCPLPAGDAGSANWGADDSRPLAPTDSWSVAVWACCSSATPARTTAGLTGRGTPRRLLRAGADGDPATTEWAGLGPNLHSRPLSVK